METNFLKKPRNAMLLAVVVLLLIIIVQNTAAVTVRLLFWKVSMSMILLLPITLLIGFAFGVLMARWR